MHLFYQPGRSVGPLDSPRRSVGSVELPDGIFELTEDDSRHAIKTLRLGIGDIIAVTDGRGNHHAAVITSVDARRCLFRITDTQTMPPRSFSSRICVAPTKSPDRIEWFVEKAVEVGVERISFFFGQHSERRVLKLERLEKIAVAAMKQSLQSYLPQLDDAVSLPELLKTMDDPTGSTMGGGEEQRFIAHLPAADAPVNLTKAATPDGRYTVLIGPEGDFSDNELRAAAAAGFGMVTLGSNRLRTETAALTACQLLNFINA